MPPAAQHHAVVSTPPPASAAPSAARPARRHGSVRRFVERLFLGSIMTIIASLLDRRLRRVFSKR